MDFWTLALSSLPGILVGALTIALGALIVWVGSRAYLALSGSRPEFVLTRIGNNWQLRRARRRTVFQVEWSGESFKGMITEAPTVLIRREMAFDDRVVDGWGDTVWFLWLDGHWKHSAMVYLVDGVNEYPIYAVKPSRDGRIYA